MEVKLDLIDGNRARLNENGWEIERIAIVYGITSTGYQKILDAAEATGMPIIGASHPGRIVCKLREINFDSIDDEKVKFRLIYRDPGVSHGGGGMPAFGTVQVGASLIQEVTNRDVNGNEFEFTYDGDTIGGSESRLIPQATIEFNQEEYASPGSTAKDFVGKVNASGWNVDPYAPARAWLCTSIIGLTRDGGSTYDVRYTFQYKAPETFSGATTTETKPGWDVLKTYVDKDTGVPPSDVFQTATAYAIVQLYEEANFNLLGLV